MRLYQKTFLALLILLLAFSAISPALATPVGNPVSGFTVSNMVLKDADKMRAQYYEFHELSFNWSFPGPIVAGDYFVVQLDPELNLHPNTNEQLQDLLYGTEVLAHPTVNVGAGTVTYTFTSVAEGLVILPAT